MDKIKIKAEERVEQGSAAVRRLRRAGKIPAAVMRMNKGGTLLVKLDEHEFLLGLRGHTSKQLLVTLDMDGKEMPALMREMQNDVVKGTPIHVDFSEVSLTQKVRVVVPISRARSRWNACRRTSRRSSPSTSRSSGSTRRCS